MLAVVVVGAVALAVGSVLLASRVIARDTRPEHNSVLSPFLTVVGLVYGRSSGSPWSSDGSNTFQPRPNVSNEASTLVTLYRQTVAMPQPQQAQVREQLRRYAAAVQGPEWGKEEFGTINNDGRHALTEMYRIVGTAKSDTTASADRTVSSSASWRS